MKFENCSSCDIAALEELYGRVVRTLLAETNYPQWSAEYPAGSVAAAVERGEQYAVTENGRILGAVVLHSDEENAYSGGDWSRTLAPDEYLIMRAVAVDPQARGRRIGSWIVGNCLETARRAGYKAVRLDIVPENQPAKRLYLGSGFRCAGRVPIDRGLPQVPQWELYEYDLAPASDGSRAS